MQMNASEQKDKNCKFSFVISHDMKRWRPMVLSHHNQDIIQDWIRALRLQAESLLFEDKYVRGS